VSLIPLASSLRVYAGADAYQFLLQVICGLQSPLLGETEVMGQFRKFRNEAQFPATVWGDFLQRLTTDLLRDARHIRQHHLQGLGSQSYGSLVRKCVKGSTTVALLGTGNLAEEILPWLNEKDITVRLFYRSWVHARRLMARYPAVSLSRFEMEDASWMRKSSALIVAAPIRSGEITRWIEVQETRFSIVVDLRGEAAEDQIDCGIPVVKLTELFDSLRSEKERLAQLTSKALKEIEALSRRRDSLIATPSTLQEATLFPGRRVEPFEFRIPMK
jgi:glutamyl-tRNA reductase